MLLTHRSHHFYHHTIDYHIFNIHFLFIISYSSVVNVVAFNIGNGNQYIRTNNNLQMKIFDWKQREAFQTLEIPADYTPSFNNIFPMPGSRKKFLRVGRGISAGQGKTCGRGMRGQKSRSGEGAGVRAGFEGGQTALYRRLPKFVGKPMKGHTKTEYELIKIDNLNEAKAGSTVDYASLEESGIVTKANKGRKLYKVIGGAEGSTLSVQGLTVRAHAFTESAKAAIESNGGKCIIMSPTRPIPLEDAMKEAAEVKAVQLEKLKALRALKQKRDAAKFV